MSRQAARRRLQPEYPKCDYCGARPEDLDAHQQECHRGRWIAARLDELHNQARWAAEGIHGFDWQTDEVAVEYRALLREWWTLSPTETTFFSARSAEHLPGSDPFRAAAIARNAIRKVKDHFWGCGYGKYQQPLPLIEGGDELARKAAHTLRRVRPDLFEGYHGATVYGGEIDA